MRIGTIGLGWVRLGQMEVGLSMAARRRLKMAGLLPGLWRQCAADLPTFRHQFADLLSLVASVIVRAT
jgi:hypothetical protein